MSCQGPAWARAGLDKVRLGGDATETEVGKGVWVYLDHCKAEGVCKPDQSGA